MLNKHLSEPKPFRRLLLEKTGIERRIEVEELMNPMEQSRS
jgi:hypothetical protein